MSGIAKCGLGCAIVLLIGVIALSIGVIATVRLGRKYIESLTAEYRDMGFTETIRGQKLTVRQDMDKPTILLGQMVEVYGSSSTNLAVVAQVAEIHGNIDGKLYFKGQVLRIMPEAHIRNGADITAQSFTNDGTVEGDLVQQTTTAVCPDSAD